ncbi:hypothetical protein T440DRAFT_356346, partial [Plenodomus tracheiphilus IPT5]
GREATAQRFLSKGADIEAKRDDNMKPLPLAGERGHNKMVELLLDKGADVNAQGGHYGNALQAASIHGHQAVVRLL